MRYLKMLGLAAVAAGALVAILGAGSASATVLCSTTVDPCPPGQDWPVNTTLDWSLQPQTSALQVNTAGETLDTCTASTMKWTITQTGGPTQTVTGTDEETTFSGCTFTTKTLKLGKWEIHKIAGTSNGTVTSDEITETTINTVLFGSCIYGVAAGSSIGDITEGRFVTVPQEATAVLHINAVTKKLSGSGFACPETDKWTATYILTSPENTTLSVSTS
jgi:hypothetical protein